MLGNNPAPYAVFFFLNLQPPFQYAEPLSKSAMHQHNIPWKLCKDDYIGLYCLKNAVILSDNKYGILWIKKVMFQQK